MIGNKSLMQWIRSIGENTDLQYYFAFAFFVVITVNLYWPVLFSGLLSDDWYLSSHRPTFQKVFTGNWIEGGKGSFYRPFSVIMIWAQGVLFGYSGFAQHLASLVLFISSAFIVSFKIKKHIGLTPALFSAAFILFHPVATETVSWISSQTDLFCALFLILALCTILHPLEVIRRKHIVLSLIYAGFCYLSKDSSVILGPVVLIIGICYIWKYGFKRIQKHKIFIYLIILHFGMWCLYLIIRKLFLESVLIFDQSELSAQKWIRHMIIVSLSVLREYIKPMFGNFPELKVGDSEVFPLFWVAAGVGLVAFYFFLKRDIFILGFFAGFVLTLSPSFSIPGESFYNTFVGSHRLLYNSLFFVSVILGYFLFSKEKSDGNKKTPGTSPLLYFLCIFLFYQLCLSTAQYNLYFSRAGKLRDSFREEINEILESVPGNIVFIEKNLPDNINGAYVFRNGFDAFIQTLWPKRSIQCLPIQKFNLSTLDLDGSFFLVNFKSEDEPSFIRWDSLENFKDLFENKKIGKIPLYIDFSRVDPSKINLYPNKHFEILGKTNDGIVGSIVGSDPYLSLPFPSTTHHLFYNKAVLICEFMDLNTSENRCLQSDVFQFFWGFEGMNLQSVPNIKQIIVLKPGRCRVDFDLKGDYYWLTLKKTEYFRFDFGNKYRGKLKIYALGLE